MSCMNAIQKRAKRPISACLLPGTVIANGYSMKLAISAWNGRVAPVFDVSRRCLILSGEEILSLPDCVDFPGDGAPEKARFLRERGVELLVCGAISGEYEEQLLESGISTVSFIAGELREVYEAWRSGSLEGKRFSMPGCGCPRRRCRGRHGRGCSGNLSL